MKKKDKMISLNELRDQSVMETQTFRFRKSFIGGYSRNQVDQYVRSLKEEFENAETSFNSCLDDYAAMTEMFKQERDQYEELFNLSKTSQKKMEEQIEDLENEIEELNNSINQNYLQIEAENELLKKKLSARQADVQEYGNLKNQLDELKILVKELNTEVKGYAEVGFEVPVADSNQESELIDDLENKIVEMTYEKNDILEEKGELVVTLERIKDENDRLKKEIRSSRENMQQEIEKYQMKLEIYREMRQKKNEEMKAHLEVALEKLEIVQNSMNDFEDEFKPDNETFKELPFENSAQVQLL